MVRDSNLKLIIFSFQVSLDQANQDLVNNNHEPQLT